MKYTFIFLAMISGVAFAKTTSSNNANPNSNRMGPAVPAATNSTNSSNSGSALSSDMASVPAMTQKLLQYNEMSRRVHDRRFRGAADEEQLKVQATLPHPERGQIGQQMQSQENADHDAGHAAEDSGEQQHD
jgi:hypothetical protein